MDPDQARALSDALLEQPPVALDLRALSTLPGRWPTMPRDRRIAIRRAVLEIRALLAQVAALMDPTEAP